MIFYPVPAWRRWLLYIHNLLFTEVQFNSTHFRVVILFVWRSISYCVIKINARWAFYVKVYPLVYANTVIFSSLFPTGNQPACRQAGVNGNGCNPLIKSTYMATLPGKADGRQAWNGLNTIFIPPSIYVYMVENIRRQVLMEQCWTQWSSRTDKSWRHSR